MRLTPLVILIAAVFIAGCNTKPAGKIVGVWQMQRLELNGTIMTGQSIGNATWEFKANGEYATNMFKATDAGTYTLKDELLSLRSATYKQRPEQQLIITLLDSAALHAKGVDKQNTSSLQFVKLK